MCSQPLSKYKYGLCIMNTDWKFIPIYRSLQQYCIKNQLKLASKPI